MPIYKDIDKMPNKRHTDQFIGVWTIGTKLWSRTFRWFGDDLEYYVPDSEGVGWRKVRRSTLSTLSNSDNNPVFIVREKT